MTGSHSDALVFFGATGDLAYKKIFPALQAMAKRGHLNEPVIGVAKAGWNLDQLKARARDSVEKHGGLDPVAFKKLCGLLRYVDGDYESPATFQSIREQLGSARRPAHYLAIPPILFGLVVEQLAKSGCHRGARVIIHIAKTGRTHLQDAIPLTGDQRASGWSSLIERDLGRIRLAIDGFYALAIGETAIGTNAIKNSDASSKEPITRERWFMRIATWKAVVMLICGLLRLAGRSQRKAATSRSGHFAIEASQGAAVE
jgi:hypothetical protein